MMLGTGLRTAVKNEVTISFGGQTMIHALVRLNEDADPMHIDYFNLDGPSKSTVQLGLLKWNDNDACFAWRRQAIRVPPISHARREADALSASGD